MNVQSNLSTLQTKVFSLAGLVLIKLFRTTKTVKWQQWYGSQFIPMANLFGA